MKRNIENVKTPKENKEVKSEVKNNFFHIGLIHIY